MITCYAKIGKLQLQARAVRKVDNATPRINHYPADSVLCFAHTYPLDSDLSGGKRYPALEWLGPDLHCELRYPAFFISASRNTYIFQKELYNVNVILARSHMKRCPTSVVNKCYSTDCWVFTGEELHYWHRSLFTGHVECCDLVFSLLDTHSTKLCQKTTKHTLKLEK